jgi:hypothetical protein
MGLVDWLRGGGKQTKDSQEQRLETRQEEQSATASTETAQQFEPSTEERRDSEAARHSGI